MLIFIMIPLFTASAFAQSALNPKFDQVVRSKVSKFKAPLMSVQQLKKETAVQILDARELKEFQVSHLQGAQHVGYKKFDLSKVKLEKNKKVVVYCSVGYRSGDVAEHLRAQGYDAYNLYGGIFEWKNNQYPVYDSNGQATEKVHTYNKDWSQWLEQGEKVY